MAGDYGVRFKNWVKSAPSWARMPLVLAWPLWLRVRWLLRDRWKQPSFYCRALAGLSDYNICINSDMTVSCNCQDYSGQGHIGDLRQQTLTEVFGGNRVRTFQEMLLRGEYPTDVCVHCAELLPRPEGMQLETIFPGSAPRSGLMVENTARCNLSCDMCDRKGILAQRSQVSLSLSDIADIAQILHEHHVARIYYFNLGEPFLSPHILEELQTIRAINPGIEIRTSTNGVLLEGEDKIEAALMMDHIAVSLDGVDQQTAEQYQRGTDFERALRNLTALTRARAERGQVRHGVNLPVIEWKYVLFRWNNSSRHIRKAIVLAQEAGVDLIEFYPGSAPRRLESRRHPFDASLREAEWRSDGSAAVRLSTRAKGQ